ncbi:hypothetical protein ABVK25_003828 [Lepraria finkii]|uniref:Uncharacterized protein n=1 Tax=Lepraria finkii TaxID=1340010 RepID=A0ABR4BEN7_9LECA
MGLAVQLPISLALCCYSVQLIAFTLAINLSNATNDDDPQILCKTTDIWTRPSWPTNIWQHCSELLGNLEDIQPEVYADNPPLHEFLAMGVTSTDHDLVPIRTPWKMTNS